MNTKPVFKPQIPKHLLSDLSEKDRWMYGEITIQRQQNEWIIEQLQSGDDRFQAIENRQDKTESKVQTLEKFKSTLTAKWTVATAIFLSLIFPIVIAFLGAAFMWWFEKRK
jgi:hypothetical protein